MLPYIVNSCFLTFRNDEFSQYCLVFANELASKNYAGFAVYIFICISHIYFLDFFFLNSPKNHVFPFIQSLSPGKYIIISDSQSIQSFPIRLTLVSFSFVYAFVITFVEKSFYTSLCYIGVDKHRVIVQSHQSFLLKIYVEQNKIPFSDLIPNVHGIILNAWRVK